MNCPTCGKANSPGTMRCCSCGVPLLAAVASTSHTLPSGSKLQGVRFAVDKVLGQGGFGITYQGSDMVLQRPVALKELFPLGCMRQGSSVMPRLTAADFNRTKEKFLEESRRLARFNHPGVVNVYEEFKENNTAYMVMEYLQGKTLDAVLQAAGRPLREQEAVQHVKAVGEALKVVHKAGVLHRDIKPENIMVADDGRVVLIDFGAAREFTAEVSGDMSVVLTPGYAPLEQYGNRGRFDRYTDVYALGATLYHLLTGVVPVSAPDRINGVELREPRQVNANVSQSVSDAVMKAMEMKAPSRFQSIGAMLDALGNVLVKAQNSPHTHTIPISVQADDNRTVVKKKRSGIAWWLLAIVLGFGVSWLLLAPPDRQTLFGVTTTSGPTTHRLITFPNGDRYEGQLRGGKQHGNGTMTWANGDRYEGQWQNGRRHGIGKLQLADGGRYEGQWANDKRSGQGTFTWPDGGRYEGQWQNGKRHGSGTFTWPNGRRHEGQWRDDKAL